MLEPDIYGVRPRRERGKKAGNISGGRENFRRRENSLRAGDERGERAGSGNIQFFQTDKAELRRFGSAGDFHFTGSSRFPAFFRIASPCPVSSVNRLFPPSVRPIGGGCPAVPGFFPSAAPGFASAFPARVFSRAAPGRPGTGSPPGGGGVMSSVLMLIRSCTGHGKILG